MTNILSLFSIIGIFTTAVNIMCASNPATLMHLLQLTGNL